MRVFRGRCDAEGRIHLYAPDADAYQRARRQLASRQIELILREAEPEPGTRRLVPREAEYARDRRAVREPEA